MDESTLRELAADWLRGLLSQDEFLAAFRRMATEQFADVSLDHDRQARCGFPEVVYGEGKSIESLEAIVTRFQQRQSPILITRIDADAAASLLELEPLAIHNEVARTWRWSPQAAPKRGRAAVVSAGTTDRPVAEEAFETLLWMDVEVELIQDVGVAGPQRLLSVLPRIQEAEAIVVVAGMEGALPSVVGGHVACPVIAVPTSVGYGAAFQGVAALLGMLNSCAANVTVVNIDAGFKGGYVAGMIAKGCRRGEGDR